MAQLFCNFFSYSLGYPVDIEVILPSMSPCDMDTPELRTHKLPAKFPVLYLLHGHGNDYLCWSRFTSMERYAEERRIAVVTVSVGNKEYMNVAYGENYFDFVRDELPEFIQANFPISEKKEDTYLVGLSMGGYGTFVHGLTHPQSYQAIGCFSAGIIIPEDHKKKDTYERPPRQDLYELLDEKVKEGIKLPEIFMCVGTEDFIYGPVAEYHQYMLDMGVKHKYEEVSGYGHEWGFWDHELPRFLDWLPRTDIYAEMPHCKM